MGYLEKAAEKVHRHLDPKKFDRRLDGHDFHAIRGRVMGTLHKFANKVHFDGEQLTTTHNCVYPHTLYQEVKKRVEAETANNKYALGDKAVKLVLLAQLWHYDLQLSQKVVEKHNQAEENDERSKKEIYRDAVSKLLPYQCLILHTYMFSEEKAKELANDMERFTNLAYAPVGENDFQGAGHDGRYLLDMSKHDSGEDGNDADEMAE